MSENEIDVGSDGFEEGVWHRNVQESANRVEKEVRSRHESKESDKQQIFLDEKSMITQSTPLVQGISLSKGTPIIIGATTGYGIGIALSAGALGIVLGLTGAVLGACFGNLFDSITPIDHGLITFEEIEDSTRKEQ